MTSSFVRAQTFVVAAAAGALWCGAAVAQPAPITYAGGQGGAAPALSMSSAATFEHNLAGGGEGSYGYGAQRNERGGALIDLRRNAPRTPRETEAPIEVAPIAARSDVAAEQIQAREQDRGQGAQAWLEQERVGPPYEANGRWYVPTPEPGYSETGQASWYGPNFHGQPTASGENFDETALSAAHPTLPIPSLVQVTNLENGREVIVRVNDRGPFVGDRLIDVSRRTAEVLGFDAAGQARVHVRYLGPAPRHVTINEGERPASTPAPASAPAPMQRADVEGPVSLLPPGANSEPVPVVASMERPVFAAQTNVAPAVGGLMVQVGAFADLTNAHRVQAALANVGQVTVDARQTARGELFRVRVGPWASRGEAEAARREIANLGYGDAVLAAR